MVRRVLMGVVLVGFALSISLGLVVDRSPLGMTLLGAVVVVSVGALLLLEHWR